MDPVAPVAREPAAASPSFARGLPRGPRFRQGRDRDPDDHSCPSQAAAQQQRAGVARALGLQMHCALRLTLLHPRGPLPTPRDPSSRSEH